MAEHLKLRYGDTVEVRFIDLAHGMPKDPEDRAVAEKIRSQGLMLPLVAINGMPKIRGIIAAIYSGRARYRTLVIEKAVPGGQVAVTDHLENYAGFPDGVSGMELGQRMLQQAEKYGVEVAYDEVTALEL